MDNCRLTVAGGFTPQSQTAESMSHTLGNRTVLSASVSKGKNNSSQSLQLVERSLMTPDELEAIPNGQLIVTKTVYANKEDLVRRIKTSGKNYGSYNTRRKDGLQIAAA